MNTIRAIGFALFATVSVFGFASTAHASSPGVELYSNPSISIDLKDLKSAVTGGCFSKQLDNAYEGKIIAGRSFDELFKEATSALPKTEKVVAKIFFVENLSVPPCGDLLFLYNEK